MMRQCLPVGKYELAQTLPPHLLSIILVTHCGCERLGKRLYHFLDVSDLFHVGSGLPRETVSGQCDKTLEEDSHRESL